MSVASLRFLHASNLLLDHQLYEAGPLPEQARKTVQEATLISFDRLTAACLALQVDFLLLAGNSFDVCDFSLRAQTALRDGFRKLADHGVRVFVLPGETDPPSAWRALPDLPDNVVLFTSATDEPVAVLRDGRVIATVGVTAPHPSAVPPAHFPTVPWKAAQPAAEGFSDPKSAGRRTPYSIQMTLLPGRPADRFEPAPLPCPNGGDSAGNGNETGELDNQDQQNRQGGQLPETGGLPNRPCRGEADYLALGGRGPRQTLAGDGGTIHHPGSAQGVSPHDAGPHGGTLVEVDAEGAAACTFLPTAPVRRENFTIEVGPETNRDELIEIMRAHLRSCPAEPSDLIWLVRWTIRGTGPLYDLLENESFRSEAAEWLELTEQDSAAEESAGVEAPLRCHTWRLLADRPPIEAFSSEGSADGAGRTESTLRLAGDYFTHLDAVGPVTAESLIDCLQQADLPDEVWTHRLHSLIAELDSERIAGHARRLGATWLAPEL